MTTDQEYLLGHDPAELDRLQHQARILGPTTRTVLELAGVAPGMRVLDLGTGAGDVAFLAAELVGPTGSVVGIDQSAKALTLAAHRTERSGLTNVSFLHDDLHTVRITGEFDAVVGRLTLLYLPDPVRILRRFADLLRPGGVVAMMEYEMTAIGCLPPTPIGERVGFWIAEAFRRSGLDASLGARLGQVMRRAGLDPVTVLGLQQYRPPGDPEAARMAAAILRTLLPVLDRTGIATPDEVDVDTLADRLIHDTMQHDATFKLPTLVGAWAAMS
ncbi:MAG TPA: class I SAM-dependent methyltransferase [Actinophytocola sp.]|uniref:class I SAM-dependent methyltransferase n=1 Tax=Actinophytocola sp. TaxID=1872138 RepID=UPI002DDC9F48|nr:class I SAM-dependent methyltransferase [Actinophytocola sp.]HEV2782783.1 class I SAM-dependent methyltransferase [Actinophytocola sp.]